MVSGVPMLSSAAQQAGTGGTGTPKPAEIQAAAGTAAAAEPVVTPSTDGAGRPMSGLSTNPTLSSVPDLLAASIQNSPAMTAATASTMNGATRLREGPVGVSTSAVSDFDVSDFDVSGIFISGIDRLWFLSQVDGFGYGVGWPPTMTAREGRQQRADRAHQPAHP